MNRKIVIAMVRKDIHSAFSSRKVWVPMVVLSLMLCLVLPVSVSYIGVHTALLSGSLGDVEQSIEQLLVSLPDNKVKADLLALPTMSLKFVYFLLNFLLVPFFLLTVIINSTVSASNSFVGEKERKTLESLLFAPISIGELFMGKVLAAFIPSYGISLATFVLMVLLVNGITYDHFTSLFFLDASWLSLILWVVPVLVLFNILLNVLISARVKTFQEAQQFGGLLVLPVVGLLISQSSGLFVLSPMILWGAGAVLLAGNVILLRFITKRSSRNQLFESQIL